jgi:hypothetical protein
MYAIDMAAPFRETCTSLLIHTKWIAPIANFGTMGPVYIGGVKNLPFIFVIVRAGFHPLPLLSSKKVGAVGYMYTLLSLIKR